MEKFRNLVFANNPRLYRELFPEQQTLSDDEIESESFEWIVPESEEEALALLAEMEGSF